MHILYFHQYFNTPRNAGGTRSYELAQKLLSNGHKVTMVCVSQGSDLELPGNKNDFIRKGSIDGIEIIQFNLVYSNYQSLLRRAWTFVLYALCSIYFALTMDYDLVFATSTPLTAGIPGIFAKIFRRKPFVFEVRDLWPELPKAMGVIKNRFVLGAMSLLEWVSYKTASGCIALSPGIRDGIIRRSPKGRLVEIVPNGCDLDIFKPGNRKALNLPDIKEDDCIAVFTGAHGLANGLHAVLDAAEVLKKRKREDIVIFFIGDGKLKPALVERAKAEGLKNCRFLAPVPKLELSKIVSCADVGLMILDNIPAFYYGTSPNKFFDYIASGLPILNNYPGWLSDLIKENNCGVAIAPEDSEAFADALCYFADNSKKCVEFGANARLLAEKEFDRNKLATRFTKFLEKVWKKHTNKL